MCTTIDKYNADTTCNNINELVKNQNESVGKMKLVQTETWTVADSRLHEAVCRQRFELWLTVGYMKLCEARDLNCG